MPTAVKTYDAKMDSKKRIPRELVPPFQISEKSLSMMDQAMENMKQGKVSKAVDLSAFEG